jgi:leucyl/phenylalanyl-tRNA---protein transferase
MAAADFERDPGGQLDAFGFAESEWGEKAGVAWEKCGLPDGHGDVRVFSDGPFAVPGVLSSITKFMANLLPSLLGKRLWFPDPRNALGGENHGLVAVGGDFSVPRLLLAYRSGIFPWTANPMTWWSPDPRGIFELNRFHVSRSLARVLRQGVFRVTFDQAFRRVIEECAGQPRSGHWITPEFIEAYSRLHQEGYAHSLECWLEGELAGGIYGVALGGFFAGESMFHRASNASKVALYHLVEHLRARSFVLFDIQMVTPITTQLGAVLITREEYLQRLARAIDLPVRF